MAEVSLFHVAGLLLRTLVPYASGKIKSWWGAKKNFKRLVSSIDIIKSGLLDAEKRQEGGGELVKTWLRQVGNVLSDAQDFFEKVITIEEIKQTSTGVGTFVSELVPKSNSVWNRVYIAGKIKSIRKELDRIRADMDHFNFDRGLSEDTMCLVNKTGCVTAADDMIGRDEDKEKLMRLLLDDKSKKEKGSADVIAIVGFGGLGKTTLAEHIFNNAKASKDFDPCALARIPDTKGWESKARIILDALQTSDKQGSSKWSYGERDVNKISTKELEDKIKGRLKDKKYLLVLDDCWDEDPKAWFDLGVLLRGGEVGSKILVTTRSSNVEIAMDADHTHNLEGLPDDKAWELFKRLAFASEADAENVSLITTGKDIVGKCKNVPLAIKAIALLLRTFRGDETKWKKIADSDVLELEQENPNLNILSVLKLSYKHLPSHLRHCFAFSSIFPKGFRMDGRMLVDYWIAQMYIQEHCSDRQRYELRDTMEGYLETLTARSFFQRDRWGGYYMHDLMYDLAKQVAGKQVFVANTGTGKLKNCNGTSEDVRIRHLSFSDVQTDDDLLSKKRGKYVRSFIHARSNAEGSPSHNISKSVLCELFRRCHRLRLLDLGDYGLESLSGSVGDLMLLRCLILSQNEFTRLPGEICKLHNLVMLDVSDCEKLEALPDNLNRLINLNCLRLGGCTALRGMTSIVGKMPWLEYLDCFKIGDDDQGGLKALTGFANLRGRLTVEYMSRGGGWMRREERTKAVDLSSSREQVFTCLNTLASRILNGPSRMAEEHHKEVDLSSLERLDELDFVWSDQLYCLESEWDTEGAEFECSQLPPNLRRLSLCDFPGHKLPEWRVCLNKLLHLELKFCVRCRHLPSFGRCPRLETLVLCDLHNLEYIQMENEEFSAESNFPRLEKLTLYNLPGLKAWSPGMETRGHHPSSPSSSSVVVTLPRFQSLASLEVAKCPELMSMPLPAAVSSHGIYVDGKVKEPLHTQLAIIEKRRAIEPTGTGTRDDPMGWSFIRPQQ